MYGKIKEHLQNELAEIKAAGLYKTERIIESPQRAEIQVAGKPVLNFCANNYLGLSDNQRLIDAAKKAMDERGFGMSSVRFICGCQDMHKELEKAIADYFGTEDTILYAACFDANGGVFEPLLTEQDAIISDALNHASIIDGVRLCKAVRYRYANADMAELEDCLKRAQAQRFRIIVTDGVFSMDGNAAPLDEICALAEKYDALVMVDECHSAGVLGKTGRGITELYNLRGQVDILTGTLGKARKDRRMLAVVTGKLHKLHSFIHLTDLIHDLPGVVSGAVIYKYKFIIADDTKDLLLHILVQHHQSIRVIINRNDD